MQPPSRAYYKQDFEGEVFLGVNETGFFIIDPRKMKVESFDWSQLMEWDSTEDRFYLKVLGERRDGKPERKKYTTRQGELVNALMWEWKKELNETGWKQYAPADAAPATGGDSSSTAAAAASTFVSRVFSSICSTVVCAPLILVLFTLVLFHFCVNLRGVAAADTCADTRFVFLWYYVWKVSVDLFQSHVTSFLTLSLSFLFSLSSSF